MLAEAMPRVRKELARLRMPFSNRTASFSFSGRICILRCLTGHGGLQGYRAALSGSRGCGVDPGDRPETYSAVEGGFGKLIEDKPRFVIAPPDYMSDAVVEFVRTALVPLQNSIR